jgi:HEAT repeat protein
LTHGDAQIRAAAVQALRLMTAPDAERLLEARLAADEAYTVRAAAAAAAGKREQPSAALAGAVVQSATKDEDPRVRVAAVRVLAAWLPVRPAMRDVLDGIVRQDSNGNVRLIAKAALAAGSDG